MTLADDTSSVVESLEDSISFFAELARLEGEHDRRRLAERVHRTASPRARSP